MKKLVIQTVSEHGHGDSQEYLCLAYENSWGAGLARNQLQFIADQINSGKIALPPPEIQKHPSARAEDFILSAIQRSIAESMIKQGNVIAKRGGL